MVTLGCVTAACRCLSRLKMESLIIIFVTVILGLIYYFHHRLTKAHSYWKNLNVPGPEPVYLFGNVKENVFRKKYFGRLIADIYHQFPKEKYVGIYVLSNPVLIVRDLDLIKNILVKDFEYFSSRGVAFSAEGLGANLFHADGDAWSLLRKRLTPMFSSGKTKHMFHYVNESVDTFIQFIDDNLDNQVEWKLNELTARLTISVICATQFGLNTNSISNEYNMFVDYGERISRPTWRVLLDLIAPGSLERFNLSFFDRDIVDFFYKLTKHVVLEREGKPKTRHDFVDLLIEMKEENKIHGNRIKTSEEINMEVTEAVVASQIALFFSAGYETTSSTMSFLLHELALNQDVQEKIIEEVDKVYEQSGGNFTYEWIKELKYLDMAISETLRKYPIVDPLQRRSVADYKVPGDTLIIPKGTLIFIPSCGIQMDAEYYPKPDKFDPDRFLPENRNKVHSMTFLSFGEGPRMCIGMRFARIEIILTFANFFRKFRVEPSKSTRTKIEYTSHRLVMQAQGGLHVGITRRYS